MGDQTASDKPQSQGPVSVDDADRAASQFTALWDEPAFDAPATPAVVAPPAVAPSPVAPAPAAAPAAAAPVPSPAPNAAPAAAVAPAPIVPIAAPIALGGAAGAAAAPAPAAEPEDAKLPDAKIEYAPPRPLPHAQKTSDSGATATVDVAGGAVSGAATSTPIGVPSAPASRPALQVVREASSPDLAADSARVDTVPPKSRAVGGAKGKSIVIGVMGAAGLLILAVGLRQLLGGSSKDEKSSETTRAEAVTAAPAPKPEPAPAPVPTPEAKTAEPAAAPEPAPPPPPAAEPEPAAAAEEPAKVVKTAERAPRPAPVRAAPRPAPPPKEKPHRGTTSGTSSSPTSHGGGAIVRESPF